MTVAIADMTVPPEKPEMIAQAQETVEFYKDKGTDAYYEKSGDKYNVHRVADNKVLKNKYYSAADIASLLK